MTDFQMRQIQGLVDARLFLKLEWFNPAGSIKWKTARSILDTAEREGRLYPGARLIESSSGNLGIALAALSAARGYHFTCVVDPNAARQSVDTIRAYGAETHEVTERDAHGGYLGTRIGYIRDRIARDPDLIWTNQYANPANPAAHYNYTGPEIMQAIDDVDCVVIGAGTTGTLMGCLRYFRDHHPKVQVLAVDTIGSLTFSNNAGPRYIPGLGTSHTPDIFRPEEVGDAILISEAAATHLCHWLARSHGLLAGGSTGSVLAAIAAFPDLFSAGRKVVAISPDSGEKYLNTVYNYKWVSDRFGLSASDLIMHPRDVMPQRTAAE